MELCFAFLSICAFFAPRGRVCTTGHSQAGAAATPLPRGQTEPTEASDLDIYNDNDNDSGNENDDKNDDTDDDDKYRDSNETRTTTATTKTSKILKIKMRKTNHPFSFHSGDVFI